MTERLIVLFIFVLVTVLPLFWSFRNRVRIFEFPTMVSFATLGFLVPQVVTCVINHDVVDSEAYFVTMFSGILCMIAAPIAYIEFKTPPLRKRPAQLDPNRIMHFGLFLVAVGVVSHIAMDIFYYKKFMGLYMTDGMYATKWEGLPVAFNFFYRLNYPGLMLFVFGMLCVPRKPWHWYGLAFALLYPLLDVVLLGRRETILVVVGSFVLPMFYVKRWLPQWWMVIAGGVLAALMIMILPAYREYFAYDAKHEKIFEVDPFEHLQKQYERSEVLNIELAYHMHTTGAIYKENGYGWGVDFYNSVIKDFLPSLLVGRERKKALFAPGVDPEGAVSRVYGLSHAGRRWLMEPGICESFWEFSFGGFILWILLGFWCKFLFDRAVRDRSMSYALFSCLMGWLPAATVVMGFFPIQRNLIFVTIFFIILRWYARVPAPQVPATQSSNRGRSKQAAAPPEASPSSRRRVIRPSSMRRPSLAGNRSLSRR
ncbi:oligosaccharide repeat unit polymerase [bacterium]|nr:oligosaccharide repeat unit polymerase [bacterium]